jgi:hypothetical protein
MEKSLMLLIRPAAVSDVPSLLRFSREFAAYERQPDAVIIEEETLTRVTAGAFLVTYLAKLPTSGLERSRPRGRRFA